MAGGKKRSKVGYESVTVSVPDGTYSEMMAIIEAERKWFDRVEFIREAIKEKIERYKRDKGGQIPNPPGTVKLPTGKDR